MSYGCFTYVTPREYLALRPEGDTRPLAELERLARLDRMCENCGQPEWRLAGVGLCFSCVTGHADPSDDYELRPE